jgi:hypothetical protein
MRLVKHTKRGGWEVSGGGGGTVQRSKRVGGKGQAGPQRIQVSRELFEHLQLRHNYKIIKVYKILATKDSQCLINRGLWDPTKAESLLLHFGENDPRFFAR